MKKDQITKCAIQQRRKRNRYRLGVPVIFSWGNARRTQQEAVGLTRDVAIDGAFILTKSAPPLKARIKVKFFFPPANRGAWPIQMYGEGRVVRVEPVKHKEARIGFAIMGKPFVFRKSEAWLRAA